MSSDYRFDRSSKPLLGFTPEVESGLFHGTRHLTGIDQAILDTRRSILERAGHTVVTVMDEARLRAACRAHPFDVAVIGQAVTPKMKRQVSSLIRENCGAVKVLEIYDDRTGRVLDDADAWLLTRTDIPNDLAERVDELAKQGQQKQRGA